MASPMALTRCLTILLLVAMTATTGASEDGANFYVIDCYPPPTLTVDSGSEFRANLLSLLGALPSAAAPTGFAYLQTAGRNASDRAFVDGLCLGDYTPECRRCLSEAGKKMSEQCGNASRRASFLDERCSVDYDDRANSSASADDDFGAVSFSGDTVPSPDIVSAQSLVVLAQSLALRVSDGSWDIADATIPASKGNATAGDRTVLVLAHCAKDRGAADCVRCLRDASLAVARTWEAGGGAQGRVASVDGSNCYLRFDISTPPPLPVGESNGSMILTFCAAVLKGMLIGVVVGVVTSMVVFALIEVYDRLMKKASNNRNAAAAAAPAVEDMSGIMMMK